MTKNEGYGILFGIITISVFGTSALLSLKNSLTNEEIIQSLSPTEQELKEIEHFQIHELLDEALENSKTMLETQQYYDSIVSQGPDNVKFFNEAMLEIGKNGKPYRANEVDFHSPTP